MRILARAAVVIQVIVFAAGCESDLLAPRRAPSADQASRTGSSGLAAGPASSTEIQLSWVDGVVNESGWEVQRSTTGAGGTFTHLVSLAANVTSYSDAGLAPLTEYCYRVRSYRAIGAKIAYGDFAGPTCATTYGPPAAPVMGNAAPGLSPWYGSVTVTWSYASTTQEQARLERSTDRAGPWGTVATLSANVTTYDDGNRAVEQQVCYRVIALNRYGESAPSAVDCTSPPRAPALTDARSPDGRSIVVAWTDSSAVEDGFELQRARADFVWAGVKVLPPNTVTYRDTSVASDVRYYYRVRATKDSGYSGFSSVGSAVAASAPPPAVTGVDAVPNGSSIVRASWSTPPEVTDSVRLERSADGTSWTTAGTVVAGASFLDDGVAPEHAVCYRAVAINGAGTAPPSDTACTIPPAGPTNLVVRTLDDGSLEYTWTDNSNVEDGYVIELYDDSSLYPLYYPVALPPNTTRYVTGSTVYFSSLWATRDGGYSDYASDPAVAGVAQSTMRARIGLHSRPSATPTARSQPLNRRKP